MLRKCTQGGCDRTFQTHSSLHSLWFLFIKTSWDLALRELRVKCWMYSHSWAQWAWVPSQTHYMAWPDWLIILYAMAYNCTLYTSLHISHICNPFWWLSSASSQINWWDQVSRGPEVTFIRWQGMTPWHTLKPNYQKNLTLCHWMNKKMKLQATCQGKK